MRSRSRRRSTTMPPPMGRRRASPAISSSRSMRCRISMAPSLALPRKGPPTLAPAPGVGAGELPAQGLRYAGGDQVGDIVAQARDLSDAGAAQVEVLQAGPKEDGLHLRGHLL